MLAQLVDMGFEIESAQKVAAKGLESALRELCEASSA